VTLFGRLLGTLVNTLLAALGAGLGLLLRGVGERLRPAVLAGVGLSAALIGLAMALDHPQAVAVTAGMVVGGMVGAAIRLDQALEALGEWLRRRLGAKDSRFVEGFTLATVVWCVGPMAFLGALQSGLKGDNALLYAKAILDGTTALFFAQALGSGVLAASLSLLVYEGTVALLAAWLAPYLGAQVIAPMTNAGGLMVAAIGANLLLEVLGTRSRLPVAVFLPALVTTPLFGVIARALHLPG
jgi:uncharacterized membrane protein YqgA involved in biofilm formation